MIRRVRAADLFVKLLQFRTVAGVGPNSSPITIAARFIECTPVAEPPTSSTWDRQAATYHSTSTTSPSVSTRPRRSPDDEMNLDFCSFGCRRGAEVDGQPIHAS